MWIVYQDEDDEGIFINAFSTEEKAIAYRDVVCKYAPVREVQLDPPLPVKITVFVVSWAENWTVTHSLETNLYGEGFESEAEIEKAWKHEGNITIYCARARTLERAKELLIKSIPSELQEKYFLDN